MDMNAVDTARRHAQILIPRLEAYRKRCGSGNIHDTLKWLSLLQNYVHMMENSRKFKPEELAPDLIECCHKAETFLIEATR